jgi:hypothetical protein
MLLGKRWRTYIDTPTNMKLRKPLETGCALLSANQKIERESRPRVKISICLEAMQLSKEPLYIRPLTRSVQIHLAPLRSIGFKAGGSSDFGRMGVRNKRIMGKPIYVEMYMV